MGCRMTLLSFAHADVSLRLRPQSGVRNQESEISGQGPAGLTLDSCLQTPDSRPAFDAEAALSRVEGDRELLRPMVGLFSKQWTKFWTEIAKAGQRRDSATLQLTAHQLQRSMESFGAGEARRVAQELEARGCKADFHDVDKNCARLKMEIERLVNALQEFTKEAWAED